LRSAYLKKTCSLIFDKLKINQMLSIY